MSKFSLTSEEENEFRRKIALEQIRPRCDGCRFFAPNMREPEPKRGECHRHAPVAEQFKVGEDVRLSWPVVMIGDWCGEFEANASLTKRTSGDATPARKR